MEFSGAELCCRLARVPLRKCREVFGLAFVVVGAFEKSELLVQPFFRVGRMGK